MARRRGTPFRPRNPISLGPLAFKGFTPYKPPPIPSGSYDPSLDAQRGQAQRGYEDLQQDIATADLRAGVDYGLDREGLERNRDRGFADIDLAGGRAREDYDREVAMLERGYQQLGRRQAEGARASGVLSGGLALQAAAKRAENMAIDRQPIDTGFQRQTADLATARTRLGEDAGTDLGRLLLEFERGGTDRGTTLTRAGRENTQYGLDTEVLKAFQAAQSGYVAPGRGEPGGMPRGQGVNRHGVPYQDRVEGPFIVRYDQTGKELSRRRRPGFRPLGRARPVSMGIGV